MSIDGGKKNKMIRCNTCDHEFDESESITKYDRLGLSSDELRGSRGEPYSTCPQCGSDEIYDFIRYAVK